MSANRRAPERAPATALMVGTLEVSPGLQAAVGRVSSGIGLVLGLAAVAVFLGRPGPEYAPAVVAAVARLGFGAAAACVAVGALQAALGPLRWWRRSGFAWALFGLLLTVTLLIVAIARLLGSQTTSVIFVLPLLALVCAWVLPWRLSVVLVLAQWAALGAVWVLERGVLPYSPVLADPSATIAAQDSVGYALVYGVANVVMLLGATGLLRAIRSAVDFDYSTLQREVDAATAELRDANAQLLAEVEAARLAYEELEANEVELTRRLDEVDRASRLAALGSVTGALAGQLQQPFEKIARAVDRVRDARARGDSATLYDALAEIRAENTRAAQCIRDVRALFSPASPTLEPVELQAIIAAVSRLLGPVAVQSGVAIRAAEEPVPVTVIGDRTLLTQAVFNMVQVALDELRHSKVRGMVSVRAFEQGDRVRVDVARTRADSDGVEASVPVGLGLAEGVAESLEGSFTCERDEHVVRYALAVRAAPVH